MTTDKQNIDEKDNMVLTEKQQKYQHYNQVKFLLVRKRYLHIKVKYKNKQNLSIFFFGKLSKKQTKAIEDQGEKQFKSLKVSKSDNQSAIKDTIAEDRLKEQANNEIERNKEKEKNSKQRRSNMEKNIAYIYNFQPKKSYKNNTFKIYSPTWNDKVEFSDGSYSVLDIQDYFECII